MKKVTLACAMLLSGWAFSQPLANHLFLGGSVGFATQSSTVEQGNVSIESPKNTRYTIAPAIGYTFSDRWLAGVRFNFSGSKTEVNDGSGDTQISRTSAMGGTLFGRYYVPITDRFFFFPELRVGLTRTSSEVELNSTTAEGPELNNLAIGIVPGFAYYPSTHWGLELSAGFIGYTSSTTTDESSNPSIDRTTSGFEFTLSGATVSLGISYLLML